MKNVIYQLLQQRASNTIHMQKDRLRLALCFLLGSTIPGTRSFDHFEPLTNSFIRYKRTSEDSSLTGIYYFSYDHLNITENEYIAYKYDGRWWLGSVEEINNIQQDAYVKFMHPPGPSNAFFGHKRLMHVGGQFQPILCKIATATTVTERSYSTGITPECNAIVNAYSDKK